MRAWGNVTESVAAILRERGPMTRAQAEQILGRERKHLASAFARMNRQDENGVRRIRIIGWIKEAPGERIFPRAIYALGNGQNVPRPERTPRKITNAKHWQARKQRLAAQEAIAA